MRCPSPAASAEAVGHRASQELLRVGFPTWSSGSSCTAREPGTSSHVPGSAFPTSAPDPPHSSVASLPGRVASRTAGDLVSGVGHPLCLCPGSLSGVLRVWRKSMRQSLCGVKGPLPGMWKGAGGGQRHQGAFVPPALAVLLPRRHWRTVRHPPDIPHGGPWAHFRGEHPRPSSCNPQINQKLSSENVSPETRSHQSLAHSTMETLLKVKLEGRGSGPGQEGKGNCLESCQTAGCKEKGVCVLSRSPHPTPGHWPCVTLPWGQEVFPDRGL